MVNVIFTVGKKISMRDYKITKNKNEWCDTTVTDSYGNEYQNYFETYWDAGMWVLYIWENEDKLIEMSENKDKLLANAINQCKEIDKRTNKRAIL